MFFSTGCSNNRGSDASAPDQPAAISNQEAKTVDAEAKPVVEAVDESIDIDALLAHRPTAEDLDFGWIQLFDGQSFMGWDKPESANWRVEDGEIRVDSGEESFLSTTSRFGDYEIQLEFKAPVDSNSGVFLRTPLKPLDPATDCYEFNIAPPDNPFPTGSLVAREKVEPEKIGELAPDQWHLLHALVDRDHIQTWVNGQAAADYMDANALKSGRIALQFRSGSVAFRNIRLRPIGYNVIPTETLDSWQASTQENFEYHLTDSKAIELVGGRANLELLQQTQNFCMQVKLETLAPATNSGVFFRCIPGSAMDGYECQIQNEYEQDRRSPKDYGTGAIFRRVKARAVISSDDEPTYITIAADGRHISTWVQGIQVVDWVDEREPNDNPREGYREEAGTVQLQGHDPESKIRFDRLVISPIDENP